jgi:hypothetical protein
MVAILAFLSSYWQQTADYRIRAELDTDQHRLKAVEYLTYSNNSPFDLETLYCHLYANVSSDKARWFIEVNNRLFSGFSGLDISAPGHMDINSIHWGELALEYEVKGTVLAIYLDARIKPGGSACLAIQYDLQIPGLSSHFGYLGEHYEMTLWYPKVCVFDDQGWHLDESNTIGEFYGEYGSYDIMLDIPGDHIIAATGQRMDDEDIELMESLIAKKKLTATPKRRRVRFYADRVHDFAWVCDPDFRVERRQIDGIGVYVFFDRTNEKKWRNAGDYTVDVLRCYNDWYGQYPYENLSIVEGHASAGMEYPQLVVISIDEDPFTRLFEVDIAHEIAHQWFYGTLGSNEIDEAWLDEGFATYSEIRYLEDKYGLESSLLKQNLLFVPPITRRFYHKLVYYLTMTNQLEKPILTSAYEYVDIPVAYANSAYSKPALFLFNLEGVLGRARFDRILKQYCEAFKFKHPRTDDFIDICEEVSGEDLKPVFDAFLNTVDYCDWSIEKVWDNKLMIENKGGIPMPVDILVETESGLRVFRIDAKSKIDTIIIPAAAGNIERATIDPYGYSLEPDYWNNHHPRKIRISPFFSLPSLDTYQIIWLPYLWYGSYDGVIVGTYFGGAQFIDYDFIRGRNQWVAGCRYGIKSKNFYPMVQYQTPLFFKRGLRLRLALNAARNNGEDNAGIGFINNYGIPFDQDLKLETSHMVIYRNLYSYEPVDTLDWELGVNVILDNELTLRHGPWHIDLVFQAAHESFGSDWNYAKGAVIVQRRLHIIAPCNIRLFAGKIFGTPPPQEQFFLSGALRISFIPDLIGGQSGALSPQERIHIPGDGNMRGYQTMHLRSDQLYCVNLEFPADTRVRIFADAGYYDDIAFDIGARFVLGPFSFNCPLYAATERSWQFNWSVGF